VIYLYLDKLSNAFSNWGRSRKTDTHATDDRDSVKEAAE